MAHPACHFDWFMNFESFIFKFFVQTRRICIKSWVLLQTFFEILCVLNKNGTMAHPGCHFEWSALSRWSRLGNPWWRILKLAEEARLIHRSAPKYKIHTIKYLRVTRPRPNTKHKEQLLYTNDSKSYKHALKYSNISTESLPSTNKKCNDTQGGGGWCGAPNMALSTPRQSEPMCQHHSFSHRLHHHFHQSPSPSPLLQSKVMFPSETGARTLTAGVFLKTTFNTKGLIK